MRHINPHLKTIIQFEKFIENEVNEAVQQSPKPKFDVEFADDFVDSGDSELKYATEWEFVPEPPIKVVSIDGSVSEERDDLGIILSNGDKLHAEVYWPISPNPANTRKKYAHLYINSEKHEITDLFDNNLEQYGSVIIAILKSYEEVKFKKS